MTVAELLIALAEYDDEVEVLIGNLKGNTILANQFKLLESIDQDTKEPMLLLMHEEYQHLFN
jgi:hypothetical protein